LAGFRQKGIPVERRPRRDKKSRVGYSGLFSLARDAIFSFSFLPIRIFNVFGGIALLVCFFITIYALYSRLFTDITVPAWASQIITISFFGGINLCGIGIVGEYVARIYDQVRGFPGYYVRDIFEDGEEIIG
jgi:dolichol-phosphate mannosyltransferase